MLAPRRVSQHFERTPQATLRRLQMTGRRKIFLGGQPKLGQVENCRRWGIGVGRTMVIAHRSDQVRCEIPGLQDSRSDFVMSLAKEKLLGVDRRTPSLDQP
jgi:hypothetical protein